MAWRPPTSRCHRREAAGGPAPSLVHMTTDHSYNDHRIALATTIADWLKAQFAGY
jgi:hypothetical protein